MTEAEQRPRSSDLPSLRPLPYYTPEQLVADVTARFPSELTAKEERRWCSWRYEWKVPSKDKKGYWTKPPLRGIQQLASSTDKMSWHRFEYVLNLYRKNPTQFDGIGCFISEPYVGLDLDHVRTTSDGVIEPWAANIIKELDSYTEISPSGTGVHIWLRGSLPIARSLDKWGHHVGRVEIYSDTRFLTVTGGVL